MSSTGEFIRAVASGTTALVRQQVTCRPDLVHATDSDGNSALHIAIRKQHYAIASFLSKQGATMSLQCAAALGDVDLVLRRLKANPEDVSKRTADGWTAMHLACYYGHPEVLSILLSYGASIDVRGADGHSTPLHMAVAGGCERIIRILLQHGASLNDRDAAGFNAVEISLLTAHDRICHLLLSVGGTLDDEGSHSPSLDSGVLV